METPHFSAQIDGKFLIITIRRYPAFVYSGFGRRLLSLGRLRRLIIIMLDPTENLVLDFSRHFLLWRKTRLHIWGGKNLILRSLRPSNIHFLTLEKTTCLLEEDFNKKGLLGILTR